MHHIAMTVSDSEWHRQLSELGRDAMGRGDEEPYWMVPFENYKTFCPYLVGSYERVADELARYVSVGYRTFILDVPASPDELLHTGVVFQRAAACDDRWILAGGGVAPLLDALFAAPGFAATHAVGWLGDGAPPARVPPSFTWDDVARASSDLLPSANRPGDAAHILFTSGSTGTPKGVVITHDNVRHFIEWAIGYFGTAATDRISGHPPLHFDLSTFDIFGTFAAGAELHLVPPELSLLPHKVAELIRESELTQWFSVPSVLNYMAKFDAVRPGDFPSLRRVLWCGEVLPTPSLIYWMRRLPHVTFTDLS